MHRLISKLLTVGLLFLFAGSLFLHIAPRNCLALDPFEPNNTIETEVLLHKGNYTGLSISPTDDDYFCVFLNKGENMSVVAWAKTQTLSMYVQNPSRSTPIGSIIEGFTQTILIPAVSEAGYYHIEITRGYATDYNLNITNIEDPPEDPYEPNNDFASAVELSVEASYYNLSLWNDDYCKIPLAAQDNVCIAINRTGGSSYAFIGVLYAPDNKTVLDTVTLSSPPSTGALLLLNASTAGSYCIKIAPQLGAWGNYSFVIQRAGDDAFEPNDNFSPAPTFARETWYTNLCCQDNDFFNFSLGAGESMMVLIDRSSSPGTGTFQITLFAPDQTTVLSTRPVYSGSDSVPAVLNAPETGVYTIKVNRTAGARGNYSIFLYPLSEDTFEPNDDFSTAKPLVKYTTYGNLACLDPDFFNVTLDVGQNLSVVLNRLSGIGDGGLSFTLFAPDQTTSLVTVSLYAGNAGELFLGNASIAGDYSIRVNASAGVFGNYSLMVRDTFDDEHEDNEAFAEATPVIKNAQYPNLALFDDDFYNLTLAASENLSVVLARTGGSGVFSCDLIAPDQVTILASANISASDSGELHQMSAPSTGTYSIRVFRQGTAHGNYSLNFHNVFEDFYEDNDAMGTGPFLAKGPEYANLALYDDDFFRISLLAGDNVSIVVARPMWVMTPLLMTLFSPAQEVLFSQSLAQVPPIHYPLLSGEFFLANVTDPGTYYLKVNSSIIAAGNYSITVRDLPDDPNEYNDEIGCATPIAKGDHFASLALYDEDYYSIALATGQNLSLYFSRSSSSGSFFAFLYGPDRQSLVQTLNLTSMSIGNLIFFASADGPYYLKVNGTFGGGYNYSISLGDALDDALEFNNLVTTASLLVNGSTYSDLYFRDVDYYNITLPAGGDFAATVYRASGGGTLIVDLFGPDGSWLSNTTVPSCHSATAFFLDLPLAGNYTLKVSGTTGAFGHYTLELGTFPDDAYEENDDFAHAVQLINGVTLTNLQLYDPDFYCYTASEGETFGVEVMSTYMSSPLFNITVYAPDQVTVVCAGEFNPVTVSMFGIIPAWIIPNAAAGIYYIKINTTVGIYVSYSQFIHSLSADPFEEDDDPAHARVLSTYPGAVYGITLDEDRFTFTLGAFDTIWYYLVWYDTAAGFSVDVFGPDGVTPPCPSRVFRPAPPFRPR